MSLSSRRIIVYMVLIAIAVIWIIPTLGLFAASVRPISDIQQGWWVISEGSKLTFDNFVVAWDRGIKDHLVNTLIITIPATIIPISLGALAAYPLAKGRFFGREALLYLFVASMVIPAQIVLIPLLRFMLTVGLNDTFLGIILIHSAFGLPFAIFVLANFFQEIPTDLIDSARIDGGSELQIFFRILAPLTAPALAAIFMLQFLWVWNDLLLALTFLKSNATWPVTVGLLNLQSRYSPEWGLLSAGSLMAVIPPLLIFALLHRI